jgi:alpha-mannosidase II
LDFNWEEAFATIRQANQRVGLFQHHDGITGTAKAHVVQDYAFQLIESRNRLLEMVKKLTELLLISPNAEKTTILQLPERKVDATEMPAPVVLDLKDTYMHILAVHNSLDRSRSQIVRIVTTTPDIQIMESDGEVIECQVSPFWEQNSISTTKYSVYMRVKVPPLGIQTYFIRHGTPDKDRIISTVERDDVAQETQIGPFTIQRAGSPISIENDLLTAKINEQGHLDSIQLKSSKKTMQLSQSYLAYSSRRSGAYIFLPDGPAAPITSNKGSIYVTKGKLVQQIRVDYGPLIAHTITLYQEAEESAKPMLEIIHHVDIKAQGINYQNKEIITRFTTPIENNRIYYTDLNALNMEKRERQDLIQASYYPITTAVSMQDSKRKMTVLVKQALGAASLADGQLEIMLDRRLNQDDGRGMGEGVQDSVYLQQIL